MGIVLAVAVGGALGSLLRYFLAGAIQPAWWPGFPFGIFIVNVSGGFAMGVIVALGAVKFQMPQELRAFLTVGILGGYTTFSTFSLDSALLLQKGQYGLAAFYVIGSVALSILALFAGLWIIRTIYA